MSKKKIMIIAIIISISLLIVSIYEYLKIIEYQIKLGITYMHQIDHIKYDTHSFKDYLTNSEKLSDSNLLRYAERFNVYDWNSAKHINMFIFDYYIRMISRRTYDLSININDETKTVENKKNIDELIVLAERLKYIFQLIDKKYNNFKDNSSFRKCYKELSDENSSIYQEIEQYLINEDRSNPIIHGIPIYAKNIH